MSTERNAAAMGRAAQVDRGLRAHMIGVYNAMGVGVAFTGAIAWLVYRMSVIETAGHIEGFTEFGNALFKTPLIYVAIFAPFLIGLLLVARVDRMSANTCRTLFYVYAGLLGVALSSVFITYTQASVTRVFFVTAASFGALSLWGYTTRRDLSGVGSFMVMGLLGVIIASVVNMFMRSSGLDWVISIIGVVVFAGLTAWDTQSIKEMYDPGDSREEAGRKVAMGAFELYLDFVNLLLFLLRFLGDRR